MPTAVLKGYDYLISEKSANILTVTLNRPEVYNAINNKLSKELLAVLTAASKDSDVRVIILTGEGKAFCSGQDLKDSPEGDSGTFKAHLEDIYNPLIRLMREMPKPIICRLNGVAAGAGMSLALACDMIIASEQAVLIEAFIGIGLVLDSGSSFFLPRTVGSARAFELAATGKRLTAQEAFDYGMINRVVSSGELDATVADLASYFAHAPTRAVGLIKTMLNHSYNSSFYEMLSMEAQYQDIAGSSEDFKEGIAAFLEKRKPNFKGK